MRKTKIVCTIGPACDSKEMMRKMIDAGMNVARINMSHGVYDRLEVTIKNLKEAIAESGQNVAILLDTKGPEVRVGTFKDGSVELVEGAEFSLFKNKEEGDETGVSLSFPKLVDIFESEGQEAIGRELLLDDGIISLVVKSVNSPFSSASEQIASSAFTLSIGYLPAADSAESITALVPS